MNWWQSLPRLDVLLKANASSMTIADAVGRINSQKTSVYAKLLINNTPFTVHRADLIITHRLKGTNVGDVLSLKVMREIGSKDYRLAGTPLLPRGIAEVRATVVEHTVGAKKRAKMRRQRKGRRPLKTIKPAVTVIRVQDIILTPPAEDEVNEELPPTAERDL